VGGGSNLSGGNECAADFAADGDADFLLQSPLVAR